MSTTRLSLLLMLSILLLGCDSGDGSSDVNHHVITETVIYLDHYKEYCTANYHGICFRLRNDENADWQKDIIRIQNFKFEWGYRYKLQVRMDSNTSEDLCCYAPDYTLLNVVDKTFVGTDLLFDIHVSPANHHDPYKRDEHLYVFEEKVFACAPEICSVIDSLIEQKLDFLLEMRYQEFPTQPMRVTQVKCSAPPGIEFRNDCLPDE